jgi:hypothetical protein
MPQFTAPVPAAATRAAALPRTGMIRRMNALLVGFGGALAFGSLRWE